MDSGDTSTSFTARVGDRSYGAIRFSHLPHAELVGSTSGGLSIIRQFGLNGLGVARSSSGPAAVDTLLLHGSSCGSYRGRVGDEIVDRPLRRGTVSFVPRATPVEIEYPASNSVMLMMLPPALVDAALADLGTELPRVVHGERNERLAQLFSLVEGELAAPGFGSDLLLDGLTRALMAALARTHVEVAPAHRLHLSPVKLRRAVEFIDAELGRSIGLHEIAAAAGLSPFHFSRVFKLATGETPYQFVGSRRLERACRLLRDGDLPLAELALCCGFASQSHFTAAFSKSLGVSPGRYRRQQRG